MSLALSAVLPWGECCSRGKTKTLKDIPPWESHTSARHPCDGPVRVQSDTSLASRWAHLKRSSGPQRTQSFNNLRDMRKKKAAKWTEPATPMRRGATDDAVVVKPNKLGLASTDPSGEQHPTIRRACSAHNLWGGLGFDFDDLEEEEEGERGWAIRKSSTGAAAAAAASSGLSGSGLNYSEPAGPIYRPSLMPPVGGFGFDFDELDNKLETGLAPLDEEVSPMPPEQAKAPAEGYRSRQSATMSRSTSRSSFKSLLLPENRQTSISRSTSRSSPRHSEVHDEKSHSLPERDMFRRCRSSSPTAYSTKMRIAILANGSRGDVQPGVALAKKLLQKQYTVMMLTHVDLVQLCTKHGVDALPVYPHASATMEAAGGLDSDNATSMLNCGKVAKDWLSQHPGACQSVDDVLEDFRPHAMVSVGVANGPAVRYEQSMGVPLVCATPTANAGISKEDPFLMWFEAPLQPPRPHFVPVSPIIWKLADTRTPLKGFKYIGSWALEDEPGEVDFQPGAPLALLREFLRAGPPPVAVGWGSMIAKGAPPLKMLVLALRTLLLAGKRGVILGGWARLDVLGKSLLKGGSVFKKLGKDAKKLMEFASTNVCFVSEAPHSWLFPQCCSAIHHGGAGTLYAAVRADLPSVVTPIFADQFSTAQVVNRIKVGVGMRTLFNDITPSELASALSRAESMNSMVGEIGMLVREEDGAGQAASTLDAFLQNEVKSGRWARLWRGRP